MLVNFIFRLNPRWKIGKKLGVAVAKILSNARRFRCVPDSRIDDLKTHMKKRSYAKMQWGVRAFNDWRNEKLADPISYDYRIYESDINRVDKLEKRNFEFAMCKFLAEIKKQDGSEYPGKTMYQLCVAIQKHINEGGKNWKLVDGDFRELRSVLDNIMKERAALNIGMVKKQAELITPDFEEKLWQDHVLGEQTPDQLRSTVLFLLGINLALHAGDEHYDLRRNTESKPSQIQFKRDSKNVCCLVYTEDTTTKANDGGLKHMRNERKIVWVYPSNDTDRCPVRLTEKYISLCPRVSSKNKEVEFLFA